MRLFFGALLAALLTTGLALGQAHAQAWPDLSDAPDEQGGGEVDDEGGCETENSQAGRRRPGRGRLNSAGAGRCQRPALALAYRARLVAQLEEVRVQ